MSFTILYKTFMYAWQVQGFHTVPETSFIAKQGSPQSDMFRIASPVSEISLHAFMGAFVTSPLFYLERKIIQLTLPSKTNMSDSLSTEHVELVAMGKSSQMGWWQDHCAEGNGSAILSCSSTNMTSATRVMRCSMNGKAFVDTWWSVEANPNTGTVDLVFGSALLDNDDFLVNLARPVHDLYSRLLLGCARANLEDRLAKTVQTNEKGK